MLAKRNSVSESSDSNPRSSRKRGLKPAKRSAVGSGAKPAFSVRSKSSGNAGYALGLKFFLFSLAVFFFFFWFLLGTLFVIFVVLPVIVLAFGAALLLYILFSLIGWARPLIELVLR